MGNVWVSFCRNWPEPSLGDQSCLEGLAISLGALYWIHTVGWLAVPSRYHFKSYICFGCFFSLFTSSDCTLPPACEVSTMEEWGRVCSSSYVAKDATARKPGVNSSTVSILKIWCLIALTDLTWLMYFFWTHSELRQSTAARFSGLKQRSKLLNNWYEKHVDDSI